MESKILSVQEANKMLPLVKSITKSIQDTWTAIITARTEFSILELNDKSNAAAIKLKKDELNTLIDRINQYITEIEDLGCFVEEFNRGIINFPSLFHGRKIFLCWLPSDEKVGFWHELDETMQDRCPIRGEGFLETPVNSTSKPAFKC